MTPKTIKGQPDNNDHKIPTADDTIIVSVIPIRSLVVSPSTPPNAMAPERQAKKMKLAVAMTCESNPSLKSETYDGNRFFQSLITPPKRYGDRVMINGSLTYLDNEQRCGSVKNRLTDRPIDQNMSGLLHL